MSGATNKRRCFYRRLAERLGAIGEDPQRGDHLVFCPSRRDRL